MSDLTVVEFKVLSGATASTESDVRGLQVLGFYLPTLTSTAMTFKARPRDKQQGATSIGTTARAVSDSDGNAMSITVASDKFVALTGAELDCMAAIPFLTLVMGTAEGADRVILAAAVGT